MLALQVPLVHSAIMKSHAKSRTPVQAAGGIVVREAPEPLIAIVRLRKDKEWVLPKGKLKPKEDALAAARREVEEETGHDVSVHEYLGTLSHPTRDSQKIIQFWHMRANAKPARKLMRDVKAVQWLPLEQAVETLSRPHERAFLEQVGPTALTSEHRGKPTRSVFVESGQGPAPMTFVGRVRAWLRRMTPARA